MIAGILFFAMNPPAYAQLVVSSVSLQGNNTTKSKIITHELTFSEGDTIRQENLDSQVKQSQRNLYNLQLFNFVYITHQVSGKDVRFHVEVEERWYWWPLLDLGKSNAGLSTIIKEQKWSLLNYTIGGYTNNFRGRNEWLSLVYIDGFDQKFQLKWNNIKISQNQRHAIGGMVAYNSNNQLFYNVQNDQLIGIKQRGVQFFEYVEAEFSYSYRSNHYNWHRLYMGMGEYHLKDTIYQMNPDFLGQDVKNAFVPHLSYMYEHKKADREYYPTIGEVGQFEVKKYFGLRNHSFDLWTFQGEYKWFHKLSDHFYLADGIFGKAILGKEFPFYLRNGLGYEEDFLRGFDTYFIYGQKYVYTKNSLKYELFRRNTISLDFLPFRKFNKVHFSAYPNLFADLGYVYDETNKKDVMNNSLSNQIIYSFGIGFDLVTYYDHVFSVGYAYNSMNQYSFFLHLSAQL